MSTNQITRKLTAIVVTDVVGYSRLMGADEEGTRAAMRTLRDELWDPKIAEHRGRLVKTMGDGQLIEFASVVDAVRCAVEIQRGMAQRNQAPEEEKRIELRIGVNLGDVIVEDDDIHGDGVNVAARLEGLSEVGGICVSGTVYDQIKNKVDFGFDDLGPQAVKNIAEPVRVYRMNGLVRDAPTPASAASGEKPSIAVLPFDNMSNDPEQEYFSDGISEDIITALSKFSWFFVIARNSSFTFKGKAVNVKDVARELGVRYVLEGSVRKAGSKVRITGQLIDALTGHHVWAERYDRDLEDIFAVQDEITQSITGAIVPDIVLAEQKRARQASGRDLSAWDVLMRANFELGKFTEVGNAEAARLARGIIDKDSGHVQAHVVLTTARGLDSLFGWNGGTEQSVLEARRVGQIATSLDSSDAQAFAMLAFANVFARNPGDALAAAERAIELNPNLAQAYTALGMLHAFRGVYEKAAPALDIALRLSPRDALKPYMLASYCVAAFAAERYEEVIEHASAIVREFPSVPSGYRALAVGYALLKQMDNARNAVADLIRVFPGASIASTRSGMPFLRTEDADRYLGALRKAGLPEE